MKKLVIFLLSATILSIIAACGAAQPETITVVETVVVKEEVEVIKEVVETVEVEVEKVVEVEKEVEVEVVKEVEVEVVKEVPANRETLLLSHPLAWGAEETLDPYTPVRFFEYIRLAYDRLVRVGEGGLPAPGLATAWEPNEDASAWTLTLREGVLFHDGSEMTSADVVYSLNRMIDPEIDSPIKPVLEIMTSIEATDDYEVTIGLNAPNVDFPLLLTDYRALIIRDGGGETINDDGIGTGPFKLIDFDIEGITTLEAFDDYWGGPPATAGVELIAIPDNEARVQALLAGQIDLLDDISPEQIALFESNDYKLQSIPSGQWRGFVMRTDTAPYDDPLVRKALRVVADRQELIDQALNGDGVVTCDHPVWSRDQYRADIDCSQDIELAKELLAEAGYPDGIEVDIHTSPLDSLWPVMLEVYQAQAAEAGITVNIVQAPADGFWVDTWLVEPWVTTLWGERPAAQILNEAWRSGASWNETYWNNEEFDGLLDDAAGELDFEKRKDIYAELQNILFETGGAFIPFHINATRAYSTCLAGVQDVNQFHINYALVVKTTGCN